jgi:hypothetical protein
MRPSQFHRGSGPLEVVYLSVAASAAYAFGTERPTGAHLRIGGMTDAEAA